MQAIDRLHDILKHLARRPFSDGRVPDEDGEIRLLVKTMTWETMFTWLSTRSGWLARARPRSRDALSPP